jgi:hypothetical protein
MPCIATKRVINKHLPDHSTERHAFIGKRFVDSGEASSFISNACSPFENKVPSAMKGKLRLCSEQDSLLEKYS